MSEEQQVSYETVMGTLEEIRRGLEALNATPSTAPAPAAAQGPTDAATPAAPTKRLLSAADKSAMRRELRKLSDAELGMAFAEVARTKDAGVPFDLWANSGGYTVQNALMQNEMLAKALDTGGASALIRQDLEPVLYELYIRNFPAFERFGKEPANGLVHAYNQITAYGDAQFMTELGTVTDDKSTYVRKTTNVAIIATRRGISLKSQFAVTAGGMNWNLEQLELQGGLRAIAHKMQKTIFQGQSTDSGGLTTNELGAYDANGFDGLRSILNTTRVKNVDPTAATPEDMRAYLDRAAQEIVEQGGAPSIIWTHPNEKVSFDLQQDKNVRYMNSFVDVTPGVQTNAVNTVVGPLPLAIVPGDAVGTYTTTNSDGSFNGGETVRDMYLLDESSITLPYLGSEGPTVLDIPIGISGQLTHLYILFGMWGLAVKAIPFSNKVRVKQA
jgi:hypothetical protein